jgi:hypothetical protein
VKSLVGAGCERSPNLKEKNPVRVEGLSKRPVTKTPANHPMYLHDTVESMGPSRRALAGRNGDAQCLAASVSELGEEGRWSVECLKRDVCLPVSKTHHI